MWIYIIIACLIYLLVTLFFTYLVHQIPRQPVQDAPDWGEVMEAHWRSCGLTVRAIPGVWLFWPMGGAGIGTGWWPGQGFLVDWISPRSCIALGIMGFKPQTLHECPSLCGGHGDRIRLPERIRSALWTLGGSCSRRYRSHKEFRENKASS